MEYRVRWEIDVDADNAHEAAKQAFEIQCQHANKEIEADDAVVFEVTNIETKEMEVIDLFDTFNL